MKTTHNIMLATVAFFCFGSSFAADYRAQYMPLMKGIHDAQCVIKNPGSSQSEMMEAQNKLLKYNNELNQIKMKLASDGAAYTKFSKDNLEVMKAPCGNMKPVSREEYMDLLNRYSDAYCKMVATAGDQSQGPKYFRAYDDLKKQVKDVADRLKGSGDKKAYDEFSTIRRKVDGGTSCK